MSFYAITLKVQHRSNFEKELSLLRGAIEYLNHQWFDIHPYLFELQPESPHNMHVHLLCELPDQIFMFVDYREIHFIMKKYDINCNIQKLETEKDINKWRYYCVKYVGDLPFDYAESTPTSRISMFNCIKATAQQAVCDMCGNIKGNLCGIYKCWK